MDEIFHKNLGTVPYYRLSTSSTATSFQDWLLELKLPSKYAFINHFNWRSDSLNDYRDDAFNYGYRVTPLKINKYDLL